MRRREQRNVWVAFIRLPERALILRLAFTLVLLVPSISYAGPQAPQGAVPTSSFNPPSPSGNGSGNQGGTGQGGTTSRGTTQNGGTTGGSTPLPTAKPTMSSGNQKKVTDGSVPGVIRLQDTALGLSVVGLYEKVLEGPPSDVELHSAVDQLLHSTDTRVTMAQIEAHLRASDEYYLLSANRLYRTYLGRDMTKDAWNKIYKAQPRPTLEAVKQSIIYSREYAERWVGAQYRALLRRCPTEADYARLVAPLVGKEVSFDVVLDGIRKSPEAARVSELKKPALTTPCHRYKGTSVEELLSDEAEVSRTFSKFVGPLDLPDVTLKISSSGERRYYYLDWTYEDDGIGPNSGGYRIGARYIGSHDYGKGWYETYKSRIEKDRQNRRTDSLETEADKEWWMALGRSTDFRNYRNQKNRFEEYFIKEDGQPKLERHTDVEGPKIKEGRRNFPEPDKRVAHIRGKNGERKLVEYYVAYQDRGQVEDLSTKTGKREVFRDWKEKPISEEEYNEYYQAKRKLSAWVIVTKAVPEKYDDYVKRVKALDERIGQCLADYSGFTLDELACFGSEAGSLPVSEQEKAFENMFGEMIAQFQADLGSPKLKGLLRKRKARQTRSESFLDCLLEPLESFKAYLMESCGLTEDEFNALGTRMVVEDLAAPATRRRFFQNRTCKKR